MAPEYTADEINRLSIEKRRRKSLAPGVHEMPSLNDLVAAEADLKRAEAEIERLQDAKRRALAIADERAKENDRLRAALKPFADIALLQDGDHRQGLPDMIDGPDLAITSSQVRAARDALEQSASTDEHRGGMPFGGQSL